VTITIPMEKPQRSGISKRSMANMWCRLSRVLCHSAQKTGVSFPLSGTTIGITAKQQMNGGETTPGRAGNAEPYLQYFDLPPGQGRERYYDFVRGDVHFFALDSDHREPDGVTVDSKQAQWLKRELRKSTAKWQIVYFHHAPYSSGKHFPGSEQLRWPFKEWGADIVLAAHDHIYERVERDGVVYLVNGLGGGEDIYALHTSAVKGSVHRLCRRERGNSGRGECAWDDLSISEYARGTHRSSDTNR
jgi:hypothetical protein